MSSFCEKCGTWMSGDTCPSCNHKTAGKVVTDTTATTHCPGCGQRVEVNESFCPYCGKEVNVREHIPGKDVPVWENPKTAIDGKMHCPHCDRLIDVKALFCDFCGKDVRKTYHKVANCTSCGKELKETATFCPACGKKVVQEEVKTEEKPKVKLVQCIKCGKNLGKDALFCSSCGTSKAVSEKKVCGFCGKKLESEGAFCPSCGKSVKAIRQQNPKRTNNTNTAFTGGSSKAPHKHLALMERISAAAWFLIAGFQALIAFILFLISEVTGFLWVSWAGACVWNIICSIQTLARAGRVERREPGIVDEYDKSLVSNIVYIAYNIFGGVFVGIVCGVFNIINRSYALKHADELEYREE